VGDDGFCCDSYVILRAACFCCGSSESPKTNGPQEDLGKVINIVVTIAVHQLRHCSMRGVKLGPLSNGTTTDPRSLRIILNVQETLYAVA